MPLANIKRNESVYGEGIAKLKRREQKTVYSISVVKVTEYSIICLFQIAMGPDEKFGLDRVYRGFYV